MSIHALIVETPDAAHHRRYLPRQRQAGPPHPGLEQPQGLPRRPRRRRLPARASNGAVHPLHVDHVGWNTMLADGRGSGVPTFPNARYLIGRASSSTGAHRTSARPGGGHRGFGAADRGGRAADLVETDHRICDEIRLVPTLGHTPGHFSVRIASRARRRSSPATSSTTRARSPGPIGPRGRQRPGPRRAARARACSADWRQAGPGDRHAFRRRTAGQSCATGTRTGWQCDGWRSDGASVAISRSEFMFSARRRFSD